MFKFKDKIFSYFSPDDKLRDSNKDAAGRGTYERYNEIVGDSIDYEIFPEIDNLVDNILDVDICRVKFIHYLEERIGAYMGPSADADVELRRVILRHTISWYKIKGTERLLKLLLYMIGYTNVVIEQIEYPHTFDSTATFDADNRVFDSTGGLFEYVLHLYGAPAEVSPEIMKLTLIIIEFNEPLYATLLGITYNDGDFVNYTVNVPLASPITYTNPYDDTLVLERDSADNLVIVSSYLKRYYTIVSTTEILFKI